MVSNFRNVERASFMNIPFNPYIGMSSKLITVDVNGDLDSTFLNNVSGEIGQDIADIIQGKSFTGSVIDVYLTLIANMAYSNFMRKVLVMQTHDFLRIQKRAAKQNLYCKISKNHS